MTDKEFKKKLGKSLRPITRSKLKTLKHWYNHPMLPGNYHPPFLAWAGSVGRFIFSDNPHNILRKDDGTLEQLPF